MASIYQLKPAFQSLLRPIVKTLAKLGISANLVTVVACVLSIVVGYCFLLYPNKYLIYAIMPAFLLFRMALNAIDGMLAREHNMKSKLGTFLNELTDVISDTMLYFPFALVLGVRVDFIVLFILFSATSEMAGVIANQVGSTRRYDGPLGKSDRAFVIGVLSILVACKVEFLSQVVYDWIFIVLGALALITTANRVRKSLKEG